MSTRAFRTSAEGFAVTSAIVGVMLAALLAQTKVLAFGSFRLMAIVFVGADLLTYLTMKIGLIRSPGEWRGEKS